MDINKESTLMAIACWGKPPSLLCRLGLGLATLLLGACATQGDLMDSLNKSLRGYEKAVRWAQFDAVYSFHKWEGDAPATLPASLKNIRVTHYETSGQKFDPKQKVMKQMLTLRYYSTDSLRELTLQVPQEWKYFPELKRWYLISKPIAFP
jgi:hypothetical protein